MWNTMTVHLDARNSETDGEDRLVGSDRVLAVLAELATHPEGVGLEELARAVGSPKPTVHRALASLRRAGFASQDGHGHYVLGDEYLRLAFAHHEARPDHLRAQGILNRLVDRFGETAHYGVLDGYSVVYRSKVDPPTGAMKLSSVVGGRNPAHVTGLGKVLLAWTLRTRDDVAQWVGERHLVSPTGRSACTVDELHAELELTRTRGYGLDDQENELGINCLAVPLFFTSPTTPSGAISVSALAHRTSMATLIAAADEIKSMVDTEERALR
jgi:IclR family acetate operon transcriptional repressor